MVLINNLTIDEINAALIRLQRMQTEVVGGEKGTTINNVTVNSESSGGGYTTDYSSLLKRITTRLDSAEKGISSNAKDIGKQETKNKEQQQQIEELQALFNGLTSMQITQFSFDEATRTLYLVTSDMTYEVPVPSETVTLSLNTTTNKLTFTMGSQTQEVTLPYINSSEKGTANGVATLDSSGRVPYSQLPESAMEFLGNWDASTNTPHLQDGTGTNGDFYVCNVGGTVTFGTGNTQTFVPNDRVIYNGTSSQWVRLPAGQVSSVNGLSGDVTLTASDIDYSQGVTIKDKIDANAVQADWTCTCATSLAYIKNKPTIPAAQIQADWTCTCTSSKAYIKNKPTLATVATSGSYADLSDKPSLSCYLTKSCASANTFYPIAWSTGDTTLWNSSCFAYNPYSGEFRVVSGRFGRGCLNESAGIFWACGACSSNRMICFLNNICNANGNGISIGGGGILIMGSGESANAFWRDFNNGCASLYGDAGCETTYLLSDGVIYFCAAVNDGISNAVGGSFRRCIIDGCSCATFVADCFWGEAKFVGQSTYASKNSLWNIPLWSVYCNCLGSFADNKLSACLDNSSCSHLCASYFHGCLCGQASCAENATCATNATSADTATSSTCATCSTYTKYIGCIRPTSADVLAKNNTAGLTHFLATSTMSEAKPSRDGHIIHMSWDSTGGYGAQFFIANNISAGCVPQYRAENGGTWSAWKNFITEDNIASQTVGNADKAKLISYASNCSRNVLISCGLTTYESIGYSTCCPLTFNPRTGDLCAGSFKDYNGNQFITGWETVCDTGYGVVQKLGNTKLYKVCVYCTRIQNCQYYNLIYAFMSCAFRFGYPSNALHMYVGAMGSYCWDNTQYTECDVHDINTVHYNESTLGTYSSMAMVEGTYGKCCFYPSASGVEEIYDFQFVALGIR